ncbi:hypothetical protein CC78DRAFT_130513 [Lojkania enalia]|uniref:Uncharacterized protein n=1 Tax=Lojkania enalia TaxID=147567 RepID=A0A9P4NC22_9PLEO|nr:hypothetical protein CC78DRAFT_130513 [Didymosphaeria enalia]
MAMAPTAELATRPAGPPPTAAPPLRMPKLAYRNPLPPDQLSLSSTNTSASENPSMGALNTERRLSTPSSTSRSSADAPSVTSRSLASSGSANASVKDPKKKKAGAVLGFLSLKEPSQLALEQFAEQQRKQAAEKKGGPVPVGLPGVSAAKLPPTVPKVNSKWDGLPESAKPKDSVKSSKKRDSTFSTTSSGFTGVPDVSLLSLASDGTRNPPNSIASPSSSTASIPLSPSYQRRDSGPTVSSPAKSTTSPSTTSLPEITYFFPDNPDANGMLPGSSDGPQLSTSGAVSPPASSPARGENHDGANIRTVLWDASTAQGFLAGEAQEFKLSDDDLASLEEEESHADEGIARATDYLAHITPTQSPLPSPASGSFPRPKAMNFSRPLSSQSLPPVVDSQDSIHAQDISRLSTGTITSKSGMTELPTLYEASVSEDSITNLPELGRSRQNSDAASLASSVTPSVMSASWYRSPRERLGLGGRIRKSDVLPWEGPEQTIPGKKKRGPLSIFGKGSG